jgi:hypothetical protein
VVAGRLLEPKLAISRGDGWETAGGEHQPMLVTTVVARSRSRRCQRLWLRDNDRSKAGEQRLVVVSKLVVVAGNGLGRRGLGRRGPWVMG